MSNKKDIREYIHYYVGCEIQGDSGQVTLSKILGIDHKGNVICSDHQYKTPHSDKTFTRPILHRLPNMVKPLLYRLEDITEEHKKELWQLVFKRTFPETGQILWYAEKSLTADPRWVLMSGVERLGIEIGGDVWADSDLSKWKFNPHLVTHYLLSKGYWLFGSDWFDEGLIIDKKTLK